MTEVSSDEKQKAKVAAAKAALDLNDAALLYGAAAGIVGVAGVVTIVAAGPAAVIAGVLGVCAFAIGVAGNRYQRLANDPPRTDFETVTVSTASYSGSAISDGNFDVSARTLAAHQLILADALDALVTSIERYDGATGSADAAAAENQAVAVAQNAVAANSALTIIIDTANSMNAAWSAATDIDWTSATIADVQSRYLDAAGPPRQSPGQPLLEVMGSISGLANPSPFDTLDPYSDPIMSATDLPPRPDMLYPQSALDAMTAVADSIAVLTQSGGQV